MILVENKLGLYLNIKTYKKTSGTLFDNNSYNYKEINTLIENGTYLVRKDDKIIRVEKQSNIESKRGEELLFYIRFNKNGIISLENPVPIKNIPLTDNNINTLNHKIWYVLNSNNPNIKNPNEDYYLCQNDIIKIGNVKLIVGEIHLTKGEGNIIKNNTYNYNINLLNKNGGPIFNFYPEIKKYYISTEQLKNINIKCNFCHNNQCNMDNPIITFCDCNFYYHFICLKNFLEKYTKKEEEKKKTIKSYYIKKLYCEKCKSNYPIKFNINECDKSYELINIYKPDTGNYMILESLDNRIYFGSMKVIFVIELKEKDKKKDKEKDKKKDKEKDKEEEEEEKENIIRLGRKNNNDIVLCDPSVSREHAEIIYENGNILIKNKDAKYGTLILVKKSIKINDNLILFQIGNTAIEARKMKFGEFEKMKFKNVKNPLPKKD